jgi:plastocyanin
VAVTAIEYRLSLSRPLVNSGPVTVELRNKGEDPHDLVVTPDGQTAPVLSFPETDPGVYRASAATLSTGRYRLVCSLPGHEALGMSAVLRVE